MKKMLILCAAVLYFGAWTAATLYDYSISVWMTAHDPFLWAETAARLGPLPVYLTVAFCASALSDRMSGLRFVLQCISFLFSMLASWSVFRPSPEDALLLLVMAAGGCLLFLCMRHLSAETEWNEKTQRILTGGLLLVVVVVLVSETLKCIWGRPRFMFLKELGVPFYPWYRPRGFVFLDDRFKSFPSGHTIASSLSFYAYFLPDLFPHVFSRRRPILVLAAGFTLFTAAGRIFAGRHYLSDTLAGMSLGCLLLFLIAKEYVIHGCGREKEAVLADR